jgi:DNA-binding NtrC family response regulator
MADVVTTSRPSVLLLEDEAPLVAVLTANLEAEFDIEVAGTADEARLLLASRKFAVILSDHMLPGNLQGLDFLMEAMQTQPTAKRILMTGYLNPELLGRSVTVAQLSACLIKPVDISVLRQELRRAAKG